MKYQTPHGARSGHEEQDGALYLGIVHRDGAWHQIAVVKEEGDMVLVSGATYYGWIKLIEVVQGEK